MGKQPQRIARLTPEVADEASVADRGGRPINDPGEAGTLARVRLPTAGHTCLRTDYGLGQKPGAHSVRLRAPVHLVLSLEGKSRLREDKEHPF